MCLCFLSYPFPMLYYSSSDNRVSDDNNKRRHCQWWQRQQRWQQTATTTEGNTATKRDRVSTNFMPSTWEPCSFFFTCNFALVILLLVGCLLIKFVFLTPFLVSLLFKPSSSSCCCAARYFERSFSFRFFFSVAFYFLFIALFAFSPTLLTSSQQRNG